MYHYFVLHHYFELFRIISYCFIFLFNSYYLILVHMVSYYFILLSISYSVLIRII